MKLRILSLVLLALAVALCFLPLFSFPPAGGSADAALAEARAFLAEAEQVLQELRDAGEDETGRRFRRASARVDEALAEVEALEAAGEQSADAPPAPIFRIVPGTLPESVTLNQKILNESRSYRANLEQMPVLSIASVALIGIALLATMAGGRKLVSPAYTLAAVSLLFALLTILLLAARIRALPIDAPNGPGVSGAVLPALLGALLLPLLINARSYLRSKRTMIYLFCGALCVLSLFPFLIMMVNATRSTNQIQQSMSLIPGTSLLNNWNVLVGKSFNVATGFRNSAIIAFGSTSLAVYFSALTAYGLTVYAFKGRRFLFALIVGIIMIPQQIANIGFYLFMYQIGWTDSFLPLVLPSIAAPATVFFMRQYLEANFQISIVEAGRIDGAGEFYIYNRVVLPILTPALATMGIFTVIASWNNYLTPLMMLNDPNKFTLPMMVQLLRGDTYRTEFGSVFLGLTITALPLIVVYFALSGYIIQGIALGSVKG